MEKGFRNALFGFRKRDVLAYLQKAEQEHNDGARDIQHRLELLEQKNADLLKEKTDTEKRLDELASAHSALIAQKEEQTVKLDEACKKAEELDAVKTELEEELSALKLQNGELLTRLAESENAKVEAQSLQLQNEELLERAEKAEKELEEQARNRRKEMVLGKQIKRDPIRTILAYVRKK